MEPKKKQKNAVCAKNAHTLHLSGTALLDARRKRKTIAARRFFFGHARSDALALEDDFDAPQD